MVVCRNFVENIYNMKTTSNELIESLIEMVRKHINALEKLRDEPLDLLNIKADQTSWSVLECVQHLNLYGQFYIPEISKRIKNCKTEPDTVFKSGRLGNYFASSMMPKEKLNKMKTFKSKNPNGSVLSVEVLDEFLNHQRELINLLHESRSVNLSRVKTAITIPAIKLKLGDTFRFVILHNERHIQQARRALNHAQSQIS